MLGIIILTLASWALLYLLQQQHLTALGFNHPSLRSRQFVIGWLLAGMICAAVVWFESALLSASWQVNPQASGRLLMQAMYWDLKSVITEELLFRGALLWLAIRWLGTRSAVAISALAFGIYHWFSYGIWGQWLAMALVLIGTGLMGWALALAFVRSQTWLLPVAIHLGWNMTHNGLFSKGPLGPVWLVSEPANSLADWWSLLNALVGMVLAPAVLLLLVNQLPLFRRHPDMATQAPTPS